ncbi:MGH1-like glycoside hydrolase domain-containing protein [Paenibacillus macerans]|uniref:MGH1-like glycoside hydrolase domain-containing protein n=1 Tax=Paenibacillus macerans TaxID=44252 RepID=UPI003D322571
MAIAKAARMAGDLETEERFIRKAESLKELVQEKLWDQQAGFFKVVPLESPKHREFFRC